MAHDKAFHTLHSHGDSMDPRGRSLRVGFLERISSEVGGGFENITGLQVMTISVEDSSEDASARTVPVHPVCQNCHDSDDCPRVGWNNHLEQLSRNPTAHWHHCHAGHYCGVVPVLSDGRVVAACKLVCRGSLGETSFRQHLELLDMLAEGYANRPHEAIPLLDTRISTLSDALGELPQPAHPQIQRAVEYITNHLTDPELSVTHVAEQLDMNPTYLGHLFAEQMGITMRRFMVRTRMFLASKLLADTDWQIKRVAFETGHRNTDWFSHIFHHEMGITPRKYRLQCRKKEMEQ